MTSHSPAAKSRSMRTDSPHSNAGIFPPLHFISLQCESTSAHSFISSHLRAQPPPHLISLQRGPTHRCMSSRFSAGLFTASFHLASARAAQAISAETRIKRGWANVGLTAAKTKVASGRVLGRPPSASLASSSGDIFSLVSHGQNHPLLL